MTDHQQQAQELYALLQELPRETREELLTEEWDVAAGREPEGDTERANWYRSALQRLAMPDWKKSITPGREDAPSLEEALSRAREEAEERQTRPEDVGVVSG